MLVRGGVLRVALSGGAVVGQAFGGPLVAAGHSAQLGDDRHGAADARLLSQGLLRSAPTTTQTNVHGRSLRLRQAWRVPR